MNSLHQWARTSKPAALQEAMGLHFHAADVNGYRKLAGQWLTSTPPPVDALKRAGIPTRKQGQGTEAFVREAG